MRTFGVLYQSGALWSSMTLAENIALPLKEYTDFSPSDIKSLASLKLSLVGLKGFETAYPLVPAASTQDATPERLAEVAEQVASTWQW